MNNKIIIVSGGSSGLGLELVKILHNKGYYVCNIARTKEKLDKVDQLFTDRYSSFCGDIQDEVFVNNTIKKIAELGTIVGLINNAFSATFKLPTDNTIKDYDICFAGVKGMINLTTPTLRLMENSGGKIINIMSSAALRGNKQESMYCAAKWAQRGYTESLKVAYKGTNIKVHGVYPGGINTSFYNNNRDYVSEEKQATFMSPCDLANVIVDNIFTDKQLVVEDLIINRLG